MKVFAGAKQFFIILIRKIAIIIYNFQQNCNNSNIILLLMIKELATECLLPEHPKLNNLNTLLNILLENKSPKDKQLATQYLTKIFKYYERTINFLSHTSNIPKSKTNNKQNSQIQAFMLNKFSSFKKVMSLLFVASPEDEQSQLYLSSYITALSMHSQSSNKNERDSLVQQMVQSVLEADEANKDILWTKIKNANLLNMLIKYFVKMIKDGKDSPGSTDSVVSLLLNTPAFDQVLFDESTPDNDVGKKQDSHPVTISELKKQYQELLLKTLKSRFLNTENANLLLLNLSNNIYAKLESPLIISEYLLFIFQVDPQSTQNEHLVHLELKVNALAALFVLVGKHGLEMDQFYDKLLKLVRSRKNGISIFQIPQCKRVYKLIENSLRSSKVPLQVISSFIRQLLELIYELSSDFSVWVSALIFNLIKKQLFLLNDIFLLEFRHRSLLTLINQQSDTPTVEGTSIKQLKLLQDHFLPQIRSLMKEAFEKDLNKLDFLDIDDFSKVKLQKLTKIKRTQFAEWIASKSQNNQASVKFELPGQNIAPLL